MAYTKSFSQSLAIAFVLGVTRFASHFDVSGRTQSAWLINLGVPNKGVEDFSTSACIKAKLRFTKDTENFAIPIILSLNIRDWKGKIYSVSQQWVAEIGPGRFFVYNEKLSPFYQVTSRDTCQSHSKRLWHVHVMQIIKII